MATKLVKVKGTQKRKAHVRKINVELNVHAMDGSVYATWKGKKGYVYQEPKESYAKFKKRIKTKLEMRKEGFKPKKVVFKEEY